MMRLKRYLQLTGEAVAPFAKQLGVTPVAVYRWLDGTRRPNPAQMRAIFAATGGAVTPNDWVLGEAVYLSEMSL